MAIYDALKDAATLLKELQRMDLYEALLNVREELQGIREENLRLRDENKKLGEQLEVQQTIEFERGLFWIRQDPMTADKSDTPVCPYCYENDKKVFRLQIHVDYAGERSVQCEHCKFFCVLQKGIHNKRPPFGYGSGT
jgi:hypothetical protein